MQPTNWAPEHCAALREYVAKGMSYAKAADAINAKFGTAYTRSAALGRGKRARRSRKTRGLTQSAAQSAHAAT